MVMKMGSLLLKLDSEAWFATDFSGLKQQHQLSTICLEISRNPQKYQYHLSSIHIFQYVEWIIYPT